MNSQSFTLLAIEDNQCNLVELQAFLFQTFPKATLLSAQCGKAGLALCHAEMPDFVLLDVSMCKMDGYEVCTKIKSDPLLRHIPVVLLTEISLSGDSRFKAIDSGADAFLTKPYNESELTAQIKNILRRIDSEKNKSTEKQILENKVVDRTKALEQELLERQKSEAALTESRQQLLDIIDFLPDATFVVDHEKKIIAWNKAMEAMTGVQKQDMIGKGNNAYSIPFYGKEQKQLLDFIDSRDQAILTRYSNVKENGLSVSAEIFAQALYDGRGAHIFVLGAPLFNGVGERVGYIESIRDISDRKRAEDALHESEELYRLLFVNSGIAILFTKTDGTVDSANPEACRMFGRTETEIIKLGRRGIVDYSDPRFLVAIQQRKKSGQFKGEMSLFRKDGTLFLADVSSNIFHDSHGQERTSLIIRDISDRKRAQDEIIQLNAELEQRVNQRTLQLENTNKELESFSYSVSHDLRAPLRGIDGWSLALLEDYDHLLDDRGRVYLDRVRSESQRMGHLIDDLLKLSRVNRLEMKKRYVDISFMANTIVNRLTESLQGRHFDINIHPAMSAKGDPQLLEIVLTNLFENAFKFTGTRDIAKIEFGLLPQNGVPTYYIRDNGVGFDMLYADKLFGAFQRMHKQSDFPGTGIGLATVLRIISRHNGRIWAESEPEKGSTFYFSLTTGVDNEINQGS
jgi:PAS domain S-box-containing protein